MCLLYACLKFNEKITVRKQMSTWINITVKEISYQGPRDSVTLARLTLFDASCHRVSVYKILLSLSE